MMNNKQLIKMYIKIARSCISDHKHFKNNASKAIALSMAEANIKRAELLVKSWKS